MKKATLYIVIVFISTVLLSAAFLLWISPFSWSDYITEDNAGTIDITVEGNDFFSQGTLHNGDYDGVIYRTTGEDPMISFDFTESKGVQYIELRVKKLSKSSAAQIYWDIGNHNLSEEKSVLFDLKNGLNIVKLQTKDAVNFRFDLASDADVSLSLEYVRFRNKLGFPWGMLNDALVIAVVVSLLFVESYVFNAKHIRNVYSRLFIEYDYKQNSSILADLFNHSKVFWVSMVITTVACYLFMLTNATPAFDVFYFDKADLISRWRSAFVPCFSIDRWGHLLVYPLVALNNIYQPVIKDLLGILYMWLGILIWCNLFKRISNKKISETAQAIFGCGLLSCSYLPVQFIFYSSATIVGLDVIISAVCPMILLGMYQRKINKVIGCFIIAVITCVGNEVGLAWVVMGYCVFLSILLFFNDEATVSVKDSLILFISAVALAVLGILFFKLVPVVGRRLLNIPHNSYAEMSGQLSTGSVTALLENTKNIIRNLEITHKVSYGGDIFNSLTVVVGILSVLFTVLRKNIVCIFSFLGTIVASLSIQLTSILWFSTRAMNFRALLLAYLLLYICLTFEHLNFLKKIKLKTATYFICGVIIIFQCIACNELYYSAYLSFERDKDVILEVGRELMRVNTKQKPVLFTGIPSGYTFDYPIQDMLGRSHFYWIDYAIELMLEHFGYHYESAGYNSPFVYERYSKMPEYPQDGYIKDWGDYVIVKMSNYSWLIAPADVSIP